MEAISLTISDSAATQFLLMISRPTWLFALSNPCVTRGSSFVDDFRSHRGCLRCRIHGSRVEAVSLMISKATGVFALSNPWVTSGSSFVEDF